MQTEKGFCGADPTQSPQEQRWRTCDAAGLLHQFLKAASCIDEPFLSLGFRQLRRPVTQLVAQGSNRSMQTERERCRSASLQLLVLVLFFTLSQMLRQTVGVYVVDARSFSKYHGSDFIHGESTFVQQPNMSHEQLHHACQRARQNNR